MTSALGNKSWGTDSALWDGGVVLDSGVKGGPSELLSLSRDLGKEHIRSKSLPGRRPQAQLPWGGNLLGEWKEQQGSQFGWSRGGEGSGEGDREAGGGKNVGFYAEV